MGGGRFKARFRYADIRFFLAEGTSGFIVGPANPPDGIPRKVIIVLDLDTQDIRNVHLKSGRLPRKEWRIYPEQVWPSVASWIASNARRLLPAEVSALNGSSYAVSLSRLIVTFRVLERLTIPIAGMLGRGLSLWSFQAEENEKRAKVRAVIDPSRLIRLAKRLRRFRPIIQPVMRAVLAREFLRLARLQLVNVAQMSKGEACVVFFRTGRQPLVVVKWTDHMAVPLEQVLKELSLWYSKLKIRELIPDIEELSPSLSRPTIMEVTTTGSLD